jgi:lysophospholipid acyltransferase (LPLAT)-like uncharacterized protein
MILAMPNDSPPKPVSAPKGPATSQSPGKVVVPHAARWHQRLLAWMVWGLVRGVTLTLRYRWTDRSGLSDQKNAPPAIYCIWHNRLALCMVAYYDYIKEHNQTPGLAALVSASKDGGFLAAILECFKVQPVRGSSSRRGRQALLELTTWAERGYDVAITPDGPRGPCYVVQDGAAFLAQVTGRPIVPVSFNLDWKIRLRSWDRFQIPLPFSRCEMIYEKPIHIPRDASDKQREELRRKLEETLRSISED